MPCPATITNLNARFHSADQEEPLRMEGDFIGALRSNGTRCVVFFKPIAEADPLANGSFMAVDFTAETLQLIAERLGLRVVVDETLS